jgi:undecaprenyl-diphosphatase
LNLDLVIFNFIHNWSGYSRFLDLLGVFFAQYLGWLLGVLFLILSFLEKNWRQRCYNFFIGLLSILLARGLVVEVISFFYERPRPYVALVFKPLIALEFSASFPSGHAAVFFALAMTAYFIRRRWSYYFFAGALLVSLGRIFVGVHWPADVLAGAAVGIFSAWLVWKILPQISHF